ncbi:MAG: ATP-binding cassette domain-containing protein [Fuerstia sp.]|nr:ATP-binding cassette domain-containing protein [Fuerstiella sp.]
MNMKSPELPITVCPSCHYGFRDSGGPGHEFVCPRTECGHRWEAIGQTIRAVQGTGRRRGIAELSVVAGGTPIRVTLNSGETVIGREEGCGLVLDNLSVSRRHARIVVDADGGAIEDLASACGTAVNGVFISKPQRLAPGDAIILGGTTLRFDMRYEATEASKPIADLKHVIRRGAKTAVRFRGEDAVVIPLQDDRLKFGRGADRDVIISGPLVSARHAILERTGDGHYLSDVQTASGTYVNGKPIIRSRLVSGDRVQIGPCLFRYEGNRLIRTLQATAIAVEAFDLTKIAGDTTLLDHLTFSLQPGEFVGLIGPSGAGKTTLLDALNGLRPATSGDVYLNDDPLYEEYSRLRHHIGYVPQDDIIHRELTVGQALTYAARLRLPADTNPEELTRVVDETLDALDLAHRRDVVIGQLSGGQRKRVSVGVELLSRPGVLFLDEPTSGLDPGTESRLMKLFRRLADQGRTVVCTTHVMENIDLFHKIVILAPGGKLAWFGSPQLAKEFFGIDRFCDLYDRMEEITPEEWQAKYRQWLAHRDYIRPIISRHRTTGTRKPKRSSLRCSSPTTFDRFGICIQMNG